MSPLTRALKRHRPYAAETAAAILAVSVRRSKRPPRRARARGKIRISERSKTATVVAVRNATFSWTRLLKEGANAVLLVTGVGIASPYLALAGLVILADLRSLVSRDLDERHGTIVYVIWKRSGSSTSQREEVLLPEVNRELSALNKAHMTKRELRDRLNQLTELGCLTYTELGRWRLKDRVSLTV